jgi:AcrR family transcriptional regulator
MRYVRIAEVDMSARARIREAALKLIAERGVAGTSVRDVARAAGVSPGLVQHHFRTKEGLCAHVDEWVVDMLGQEFRSVAVAGSMAEVSDRYVDAVVRFGTARPELPPYIARTMLEGGAVARGLFEGLLRLTRGNLDLVAEQEGLWPGTDLTWAALNITLMWVAPLLLQPLVEQHLDRPLLSDDGIKRWRDANAAFIRHGVVRPEGGGMGPA